MFHQDTHLVMEYDKKGNVITQYNPEEKEREGLKVANYLKTLAIDCGAKRYGDGDTTFHSIEAFENFLLKLADEIVLTDTVAKRRLRAIEALIRNA